MAKASKYKKLVERIIRMYAEEELKIEESKPKLCDDAYDILMKKTKGRVIDEFLTAKAVDVELKNLILTHRGNFYSIEDMLWKIDDKEPINVIFHKKKFLVLDGHHRVLIHKILNKKKIRAKVIYLDNKKKRKKS